MTEDELRALVRTAIARVRTGGVSTVLLDPPDCHASHVLFVVPDGSDQDGPCIIEPAVACNHCGYCKSLGH
jgi:hypothetical protein